MRPPRRWAAYVVVAGLVLAAVPLATAARPPSAPAQATEPYPTLPPTRPFPTLPSNVPSPAPDTATPTPVGTLPTVTPTASLTLPPPETRTPPATDTDTPTASVTPRPTVTPTVTVTAPPSATRYLDLGRILRLPYAAQFDVLPGRSASQGGARGAAASKEVPVAVGETWWRP